jgi:hypothetical protein
MSKDKRQELLEEAKELNLTFANNITTDKLEALVNENKTTVDTDPALLDMLEKQQEQINTLMKELATRTEKESNSDLSELIKALRGDDNQTSSAYEKGIPVEDTPNRADKIKKAWTLIRCRVIPRDPTKQKLKAELITFSNDLVGDISRRVDFNVDTHLPYAVYKVLLSKKVKIYDDGKEFGDNQTGRVTGGADTVSAYSVQVLPPLTEAELKSLARKQRLRSEDLDAREDAILEEEDKEEKSELESLGYSVE